MTARQAFAAASFEENLRTAELESRALRTHRRIADSPRLKSDSDNFPPKVPREDSTTTIFSMAIFFYFFR